MLGVWIVYDYDVGPYPIRIFKEDIDAYRFRETLGYGHVKFWTFDSEWRKIDTNE